MENGGLIPKPYIWKTKRIAIKMHYWGGLERTKVFWSKSVLSKLGINAIIRTWSKTTTSKTTMTTTTKKTTAMTTKITTIFFNKMKGTTKN